MCWELHVSTHRVCSIEHWAELHCSSLVSLVWTQTKASSWNGHSSDSIHSHPHAHIKGSVASLHNTRVCAAPASCSPDVAVLTVLVDKISSCMLVNSYTTPKCCGLKISVSLQSQITHSLLVDSFPGARFPGARDSRTFSFPNSREWKCSDSRTKTGMGYG